MAFKLFKLFKLPAALLTFLCFSWLCTCVGVSEAVAELPPVDFNRDVRPILSDKCYACHGPDEGSRPTELRLDDEASARSLLDSEVRAIVPHDPRQSELIHRITTDDEDLRMPPAESSDPLSEQEIATLRTWIEQGAKWGVHWSFNSPRRPAVPDVNDPSWPNSAMDFFVLQSLDDRQWQPSPRAGRRTLIRRATLAATGLPPTPEEVDAFVNETSPNAYRRLVDRLLESPAYGEHQARYWLDLARYGDTHGLHLDNERTIWRYRDWVIDAFNNNLPFDQFTVEQLAGDLLPNATLDQKIATGFHRCNVTTSEGGAIAEEFLTRYAVDRVETTATVWLGLTAGCAACHDHKFDPISQKDFYQLYAYFYNLTEKAMDGNAKLPPPSIKAPTYLQNLQQADLKSRLAQLQTEWESQRNRLRVDRDWEPAFLASVGKTTPAPSDAILWLSMNDVAEVGADRVEGTPQSVPGPKDSAVALDGNTRWEFDGLGDFKGDEAFSYGAWVRIQGDGALTVLSRMDDDAAYQGYDLYFAGRKAFVHIIHQWPNDVIRVNTSLPIRAGKWQHVLATYDGSGKAQGVAIYVDGVPQELERTHDSLTGSIQTKEPLRIGRRKQAAAFRGELDEVMLFDRALSQDEVEAIVAKNPLAELLVMEPGQRSDEEDNQVLDAFLRTQSDTRDLLDQVTAVEKQLQRLQQQIPSTLVMADREGEPRTAYVLVRGEYDKKGEPVAPNVLRSLLEPAQAKLPQSPSQQSRLELARWLVDDRHPLTARVTVNRIWQQYFGIGLVKTAEDFGSQGEYPSHPELLDYLATEFMARGWDVKAMHRMILLSATFQQSSKMNGPSREEDPENRWLSRGPRFRLDAEVIRDLAMASSGLLVEQIGGPSVKPYQPIGLWKAVGYTSSNTANFRADSGERLYRRGLYTFWKRTSPPPQMQILDAPSREVCTVSRPRTNTPAAALLMMNDVQFVEAARQTAERVLKQASGTEQRLTLLFEICVARPPTEREKSSLKKLLANVQAEFDSDADAARGFLTLGEASYQWPRPAELAAWTIVCSSVLNLDETITQH